MLVIKLSLIEHSFIISCSITLSFSGSVILRPPSFDSCIIIIKQSDQLQSCGLKFSRLYSPLWE
nr:MAG TPA: hypothetical protein [Caudoviricetes sp.]